MPWLAHSSWSCSCCNTFSWSSGRGPSRSRPGSGTSAGTRAAVRVARWLARTWPVRWMEAELVQLDDGDGAPKAEPEAEPEDEPEAEPEEDKAGSFWAALPAELPHPGSPARAIESPAAQIKRVGAPSR